MFVHWNIYEGRPAVLLKMCNFFFFLKNNKKHTVHFHLLAWRNAKKKKKRKLIWDKSAWKESYWLQNDFPRSQKANLCGGLFQEEEGEKKFRQVSSHRASLSSSGCQRETLGSERQLQLKLRRPELPRKAGGCLRLISIPWKIIQPSVARVG